MTRPPQRDLFVSERPVRSDFARGDMSRERSYALRRRITLAVLAFLIGGGIYAALSHGPTNPADIPTIKAEGAYKQKPADPGGIDIPHQDVRVYDQLDNKNGTPITVEHLLPPPETPKDVPHITASVAPSPVAPQAIVSPPSDDAVLSDTRSTKPVATTATPVAVVAPVPPPAAAPVPTTTVAPKQQQSLTIDQVLANTKSSATATPAGNNANALGDVAVQLASVADQAKAQDMMKTLQSKYAAALGDATLRLVRADLGKRGITYRIQSQSLSESEAAHICSTLKQSNAGCILVRK